MFPDPEELFEELFNRALRMIDLTMAVNHIEYTEEERSANLAGISCGIAATMGELQEKGLLVK